jgi:hypothetical protein
MEKKSFFRTSIVRSGLTLVCGKKFKSFDLIDFKIIAFEGRRK